MNKPKYHFFKNTSYALSGLGHILKSESSFRIEIICISILLIILCFLDIFLIEKLLMFISLMGILICEAINSAIERVVDLVTDEYKYLAGKAKDAGSAAVFISITTAVIVWISILTLNFIF